jgi:hypothetical protein
MGCEQKAQKNPYSCIAPVRESCLDRLFPGQAGLPPPDEGERQEDIPGRLRGGGKTIRRIQVVRSDAEAVFTLLSPQIGRKITRFSNSAG